MGIDVPLRKIFNISIVMREKFILLASLMILSMLLLVSCAKEDDISSSEQEYITIDVVKDNIIPDAGATRASTDGASTSLSSGDALGLYVLDSSGKVVSANVKFEYSGSTWNTITPVPWSTSYKYYAYFPYQDSPVGGPAVGNTFSSTTADNVFASLVSSWTPKADQSTAANFIASDLCTALGSASSSKNISFVLKHKMGLICGRGISNYKLTTGSEYTFSGNSSYSPSFSGNIPYKINDVHYFIAKPDINTTLGGKTLSVASGTALSTYWTDPSTGDFQLQLGDIVYTDGAISHQSDALLVDKEPCGVVVYISDTSNANNSKILEGKTHALVLGRNSLGGAPWGYYGTEESTSDFPLIQNNSAIWTDFNGINKTNLLAAKYDGSTATAKWTDSEGVEQTSNYTPYKGPYLVANYTGKKPEGSTQWFLPASGQWVAFLNQVINSGGGKPISTTEGWYPNWVDNDESNPCVAYKKLSTWCSKAGGSFASTWYWTSSQFSAWYGVGVNVYSSYGVRVDADYKFGGSSCRCFFAF